MKNNKAVVYICATILAAVGILATALIIVTVDKSELPEGWLALFVGTIGTTLGVLVTLSKVADVANTVDDLNNGRMDAKIKANIAQVIDDRYLDPEYRTSPQREADKARRDSH